MAARSIANGYEECQLRCKGRSGKAYEVNRKKVRHNTVVFLCFFSVAIVSF